MTKVVTINRHTIHERNCPADPPQRRTALVRQFVSMCQYWLLASLSLRPRASLSRRSRRLVDEFTCSGLGLPELTALDGLETLALSARRRRRRILARRRLAAVWALWIDEPLERPVLMLTLLATLSGTLGPRDVLLGDALAWRTCLYLWTAAVKDRLDARLSLTELTELTDFPHSDVAIADEIMAVISSSLSTTGLEAALGV